MHPLFKKRCFYLSENQSILDMEWEWGFKGLNVNTLNAKVFLNLRLSASIIKTLVLFSKLPKQGK